MSTLDLDELRGVARAVISALIAGSQPEDLQAALGALHGGRPEHFATVIMETAAFAVAALGALADVQGQDLGDMWRRAAEEDAGF